MLTKKLEANELPHGSKSLRTDILVRRTSHPLMLSSKRDLEVSMEEYKVLLVRRMQWEVCI